MMLEMPQYLERYKKHLIKDIIPFWEKYSYHPSRGGLDTCLFDDGSIISTDRYMWSQLRALWTFSALYNRIRKNQLWIQIAEHTYHFIRDYGRDWEGNWNYRLDEKGQVLDGPISIYTDGFAIYGLTEYYRANGDSEALQLAMDTYNNVKDKIKDFEGLNTYPYNVPPGCKTHGVSMMFSLAFDELYRVTYDEKIFDEAYYHSQQVIYKFFNDERGLLFEFISKEDKNIAGPMGNIVLPGHAIESSWFQLQLLNGKSTLGEIGRVGRIIKNHLEVGWDNEYGGLFLAVTPERDSSPAWEDSDTKPWWPPCEALVALLMLYRYNSETWCIDWFRKIDEYIFSHYPNNKDGDWHQNLDRSGKPITKIIGLPVKDIMHHIRAFIYCIEMMSEVRE